jgi:hypothetical protein
VELPDLKKCRTRQAIIDVVMVVLTSIGFEYETEISEEDKKEFGYTTMMSQSQRLFEMTKDFLIAMEAITNIANAAEEKEIQGNEISDLTGVEDEEEIVQLEDLSTRRDRIKKEIQTGTTFNTGVQIVKPEKSILRERKEKETKKVQEFRG